MWQIAGLDTPLGLDILRYSACRGYSTNDRNLLFHPGQHTQRDFDKQRAGNVFGDFGHRHT